ncbi:MAG: hypothetical protein A2Y12_04670 [Planctomycetes bacterium GWF2_42_9]|nr:MAG: hypothetical protein A2Y12_04670 [Planctomycetes bacterium GWF2_42_9]
MIERPRKEKYSNLIVGLNATNPPMGQCLESCCDCADQGDWYTSGEWNTPKDEEVLKAAAKCTSITGKVADIIVEPNQKVTKELLKECINTLSQEKSKFSSEQNTKYRGEIERCIETCGTLLLKI